MPHEFRGIETDFIGKGHLDDVVQALVGTRRAAVLDTVDVGVVANHPFGVEEPDRQVEVVARGAHGDGNALLRRSFPGRDAKPDLHRLLDGDQIGRLLGVAPMKGHVDALALRRCRRD